MPRVMISYRNVDGQREFALELEKMLSDAGIDTWIDVNDIPRLSQWEDEIFKGIINSDYVILCMSPEYFESETCLIECYVARGYGKALLPLIVPHDRSESVFNLVNQFPETRGIDHLNFLDIQSGSVLGLKEDIATMTQRIVGAIHNPIATDIDYDVFFSFKWQNGQFATRIADDLNEAGIKSFIHTRAIDVGADWRHVSWNATLRSNIHIVTLSPEVANSIHIKNEVLVSRTQKDTVFLPILAKEFVDDETVKATIRQSFSQNKNLSMLNDIQWFVQDTDYDVFIRELIKDVKILLEREK